MKRSSASYTNVGAAVLLAMVCSHGTFGAQNISKAEELYRRTEYEASAALLNKVPKDSAVSFLLGRDYFMMGEFKKSSEYLEQAAAGDPSNSEYLDWLGRAYGKRAEMGNPLMAPSWASKARQAFEKSVQADGTNRDALDDLFDYYLEAPGFLGGGYDKAAAIAEKLSVIDPGEGYYDKFKLDQRRREPGSAERHLRQAVAAAPHSAEHIIALARFLANSGRISESDAVFAKAQEAVPNVPKVWFAQADLLVKQHRNLEEAKALLTKYVNSPITADDPPRQEALRLLKQVGGV